MNKKLEKKSNRSDTVSIRIAKDQAKWLERFEEFWTIMDACKATNIDRSTYYEWMKKYPKFKEAKEAIEVNQVEFVESKLYQAIEGEQLKAIMFYLARRGGDRWRLKDIQKHEGEIKTEFQLNDDQFQQIINFYRGKEKDSD